MSQQKQDAYICKSKMMFVHMDPCDLNKYDTPYDTRINNNVN